MIISADVIVKNINLTTPNQCHSINFCIIFLSIYLFLLRRRRKPRPHTALASLMPPLSSRSWRTWRWTCWNRSRTSSDRVTRYCVQWVFTLNTHSSTEASLHGKNSTLRLGTLLHYTSYILLNNKRTYHILVYLILRKKVLYVKPCCNLLYETSGRGILYGMIR